MATNLRFVILGDDQASKSFDRFARSIDNANRSVGRSETALKQQDKTAKAQQGTLLQLTGTITGLGDAQDVTSAKSGVLRKALGAVGLVTGLAEPAVSALVVTTGALASVAVTAAAGLGVFGIVAKSVFTSAATGAAAAQKAQDTYKASVTRVDIAYGVSMTKAATAAQRQAATVAKQAGLQTALAARVAATAAAWAGLSPSQVQLGKAIAGAKSQWEGFVQSASPGVASVLTQGIGLLPRVLQLAKPLLAPVEDALSVILGQLSSALWSKSADGFVKMLADNAEPVILSLAGDIGHVITGVGGILRAFVPFQGTVLSGLDSLTSKFAKWGATLGSHSGFQSMITQWKQNWPLMKQGLQDMLGIVTNVAKGMAGMSTPANSRLLWQVANPVLALADKLSSSPALVNFFLYMVLIGKGSKQISGVFASLKTGWAGLSKAISLITGGKVNLGMQGAGDTMLVAAKNMQAAADTMAGAGVAKDAATGAASAEGSAAAGGFLAKLKISTLGAALAGSFLAFATSYHIGKTGKTLWSVGSAPPQDKSAGSQFMAGFSTNRQKGATPGNSLAIDAIDIAHFFTGPFTRFFTMTVPAIFGGFVGWLKANWGTVAAILAGPVGIAVLLIVRNWQTIQNAIGAVISWLRVRFAGFVNFVLGVFGAILNGAAAAFGWIPGIGAQLRTAAARFGAFRDHVNDTLLGIKPRNVTVGVNFAPYLPGHQPADIFHFSGSAAGGLIRGPGGPTADKAGLWALSDREYVMQAAAVGKYGVPFMAAVNAGKLAAGGLAVTARTPTLAQIYGGTAGALQGLATASSGALTAALGGMGGGGGGAARWASVILAALAMLGQPSTWLGVVERRMNQESGGNPNAINLCVPLETVILTRRGWLKHSDVRPGDQTIGYNRATGRSEWTTVTSVHHYDDAPLVRMGNSRWHATTTPEHRWVNLPRVTDPAETLPGSCPLCPWPTQPELRTPLASCPECGWTPAAVSENGVQIHRARKHGVPRPPKVDRRVQRGQTTEGGLRIHLAKAHGISGAGSRSTFAAGARWVTTRDVRSRDRLLLAAPADTEGTLDVTVQEAAILGWIAGDGHVQRTGRGRHSTFRLTPDYWQDLLARAGDPKLDAVRQILAMSTQQRAAWLDAMTDAAGHRAMRPGYVRPHVSLTQTLGPVHDAIVLAAYLAGFRPRVLEQTRGHETWADSDSIHLNTPVVTGAFLRREDAGRGPAWCVSTELGSWTAEEDGHVFLTGNSDSNARAGDPSRGLLQTIMSTFQMWRSWSLPDDIYNPLANVYAGLNYALHRYGTLAALSRPGGYARGGLITYDDGGWLPPGRSVAVNNTGEPERVLPPGRGTGPLLHIGEVHVRDAADIELIAQRLSFTVLQAGLG